MCNKHYIFLISMKTNNIRIFFLKTIYLYGVREKFQILKAKNVINSYIKIKVNTTLQCIFNWTKKKLIEYKHIEWIKIGLRFLFLFGIVRSTTTNDS